MAPEKKNCDKYDDAHGVDCDDDDIVRQTHLPATSLTGTCAGITVICEHFNGHTQLYIKHIC